MGGAARKPIYRARNVALAVLAAGLAWIGLAVRDALTAKSGSAVDYHQRLVDLVESYQAEAAGEPNGWPILLDAIGRLEGVEARVMEAAGGSEAKPGDWPASYSWPHDFRSVSEADGPGAVRERTLAVLEDLRAAGVFDRLGELAGARRVVRPRLDGPFITVQLPEVGRSRQLARACAARMSLAARAGDSAELAAAFGQTLGLGRALCQQGTLIDRLTGMGVVSLAVGQLRQEMTAGARLDGATGRALLAALDRQVALMPPFALALEGERIFALDAIQRTYTDNGRGGGRLILTQLGTLGGAVAAPTWASHPIVNIAGILYPGKADATARVNAFYDRVIGLSRMPRADRAATGFDPDAYVDALPRGHVLLRQVIPAIGRPIQGLDRWTAEVEGGRLMLALEVWRAERGEYPDRLEALVPSVVSALPIDPFTGRTPGYRRVAPGGDPFGRPYVLYSAGADGRDNGGAGGPGADAMSDTGKGSDDILNPPPAEPRP